MFKHDPPLSSQAAEALSQHERKKKRKVPVTQTNRKPDYRMPPPNAGTPSRG